MKPQIWFVVQEHEYGCSYGLLLARGRPSVRRACEKVFGAQPKADHKVTIVPVGDLYNTLAVDM